MGGIRGTRHAYLCNNCMLRVRRRCARQHSKTLRWRSSRLRSLIVHCGKRLWSSERLGTALLGDGCEINFNEAAPTRDDELPVATGGVA